MKKPPPEETPIPHWKAVEEALSRDQSLKWQARQALGRQRGTPLPSAEPGPSGLPALFVTDTIARRTLHLLKTPQPETPLPAVVYWFGFATAERACVTTLMVPEEELRSDAVLASAVANEEVFSAIVSASLAFLGQVRLQADTARTTARKGDVQFNGAFSIEVPPESRVFRPEECVVYRQIQGKRRRIAEDEVRLHLRLLPGFKDLR